MEFPFPFTLRDGAKFTVIEVDAEVTKDDTLIGLTFPIGCRIRDCLSEALRRVEEIEERAVDIYIERLREIPEDTL